MRHQAEILIGKTENGITRKLCTGKLYPAGACFPLTEGMTEADHENISRAARFLYEEKAAKSADLEGGYRVLLF